MAKKKPHLTRHIDTSTDEILSQTSPWPLQEAYKALRTNVIFSIPGSKCKVINVSSSVMHEGKSINAINLALAFSQLGKKTLLIDCDLRMPTIGMRLKITNRLGLSNLLSGQCTAGDAFVRLPKYGIDVLNAGSIPPDPTWLLASDQMKQLIDRMRSYYDYIILDTTPITAVTDGLILSRVSDGYIIVVRHDVSDYRAISETLVSLKRANAKVLGFIYNDAKEDSAGYYKSYYKSYYRR